MIKAAKRKTPIMIGVQHNTAMNAWDCVLLLGNFASKKEAQEAGNAIKELMERDLGVIGQLVT